jgi:hypothetical protein
MVAVIHGIWNDEVWDICDLTSLRYVKVRMKKKKDRSIQAVCLTKNRQQTPSGSPLVKSRTR